MNIPDPAVYATLPMFGGMVVWIGTQFVKSVTRGDTGAAGPQGIPGATMAMTVRDYQQISDLMKQELNGRYMFADESRKRFDMVDHKIDGLERTVKALAANLSGKSDQ